MALYTIGEVALLCDINPVTLRAWQRRYGLLKPQRTDGGHRLFNDADIDPDPRDQKLDRQWRTGRQGKIASEPGRSRYATSLARAAGNAAEAVAEWQFAAFARLDQEQGRDYPAQTLITHLFIPLRRRLQCQQTTLQALLSMLDGVLINYISVCLASARNKNSKDALVIGWNVHDTTRLWLEAWIATQQGWRVDVLAHSLAQLRPELFEGQTLLVWCGESPPLPSSSS